MSQDVSRHSSTSYNIKYPVSSLAERIFKYIKQADHDYPVFLKMNFERLSPQTLTIYLSPSNFTSEPRDEHEMLLEEAYKSTLSVPETNERGNGREDSIGAAAIPFEDSRWAWFQNLYEANADKLPKLRAEFYNAYDHIEVVEYLNSMGQLEERSIKNFQMFSQIYSYATPVVQDHATQVENENEKAFFKLLLESAAIIKICKVLSTSVAPDKRMKLELPLVYHLRDLVDALTEDVRKFLVDVKEYHSKRSTYRFSKAYSYREQVSLWIFKFESHRKIFQTALALYLSLGTACVDIDERLAFAFKLFPQLKHAEERSQIAGSLNEIFLQNVSTVESGSASTRSSYTTAGETLRSFSTSSLSHDQNHTTYSVASSRTSESDYGLYYRRMALSQIFGDSTGVWMGLNWGSGVFSGGESISSTTDVG
ncbi:hypothetical protein CVT25_003568 [Psilocybe cyanescens]|uniref:Uncharacterized protein n=1 Tax=Psilocybe cyanescens TaxID=93625 RepID=A0A409WNX9_PSICY|nr:hypothetical protein CVT25_003568 [Psilocybe cyanescens]